MSRRRPRPAWCQRPVEERELVAHEPCLLDEWTLVEAAGDLHCSIGTGAVHRADHRGGCAARGHQRWVPPHPCHRGSAPVRRPRRAARGPGRRAAHGSGHGVGPARGTRHPAGSLRRQQHRPRTRPCTAATTATTAPFLCQRAGADTTCERQESTMTAKPRPTVAHAVPLVTEMELEPAARLERHGRRRRRRARGPRRRGRLDPGQVGNTTTTRQENPSD